MPEPRAGFGVAPSPRAGIVRLAMAKPKDKPYGDRTVATNRRARFEYELGERYEAGISLQGSEVRALREHGADLSDAWVDVTNSGSAQLKGMRIPVLKHAFLGHEEKRTRSLLLHRSEIDKLRGAVSRDGLTLIVTRCYFTRGRAKVEIALGKGKKQHDKRRTVRERDAEREARAAMADAQRGRR